MSPTLASKPEPASLRVSRLVPLLSWLLALFFGLYGLRNFSAQNLHSDGPNHLMNGALVADWLRSGEWLHPVPFATAYYARFPATTIPFHPPVFPAFESFFFLLFGAKVEVARMVIALLVVVAVLLMYRFALRATGSPVVALASTAVFFSMEQSLYLATNVMLEMPTLVLILAAVLQLSHAGSSCPLPNALAYGALATLAMWTKQQSVLLGLVPFAWVALTRRWRLLLRKEIWIVTALFAAAVLSYMTLTARFSGAGGAHEIPPQSYIAGTLLPRAMYYFRAVGKALGWPLAWFLVPAFAYALWEVVVRRRNQALAVPLAWAPSAFGILFLTGHLDGRYLFFFYAPALIVALAVLHRWIAMLSRRWAWTGPAALVALSLAYIPFQPPLRYLRGPAEAGQLVVRNEPTRILYCGKTGTANFVFGVRSRDPKLSSTVIRAETVNENIDPAMIVDFARTYGIDYLVLLENARKEGCDTLRGAVPQPFILDHQVALDATDPSWRGHIRIYRFPDGADSSKSLRIRVRRLNKAIDIDRDE